MVKEPVAGTWKTVEYQGYTIQLIPRRLGGDKWGLQIFISMEDTRGIRTRQFSTDGVYANEQEAEVHGVAFGQRIIDGKVEGRSVVDMKTSNRRATPRLRVQFRTAFSVSSTLQGVGVLLDLSVGGCRIESPVTVEPGISLETAYLCAGPWMARDGRGRNRTVGKWSCLWASILSRHGR